MKIVVLDGHVLNPGDLDWAPLEKLGKCTVHERTPESEVLHRAQGAEIVLTNKVAFGPERMRAFPQLRYIGVTATGYNIIDLQAARELGITVTNVPAYSTESVAEMVFALILDLFRKAAHHDVLVKQGRWSASPDFSFVDRPQRELTGRTLGLVGFGAIGQRVAHIAQAFGMKVQVSTRDPGKHRSSAGETLTFVDLDALFSTSDIVSLHCPLTQETHRLVDRRRLHQMKPDAFLVNTSRGGVVDEQALAEALREGAIAGAGLDVLTEEPPPEDHPLLAAPNTLITPHMAWATRSARALLLSEVIANVEAFLSGEPRNIVS